MSSNAFVALKALVNPPEPMLIGEVLAHNADGTSTVVLPGGGVVRARGVSVAEGSKAFVMGGEVRGAAPALDSVTITVY